MLVLFALLALTAHVRASERARQAQQRRALLLGSLAHVERVLSGEMSAALVELSALADWVGLHPELSMGEFAVLSAGLRARHPALRGTTWLPGDVIAYAHPPKPALIGLDVGRHPVQGRAVLAMQRSGRPVVTGPIQLAQGGAGLVLRAPVFHVGHRGGATRGPYLGHVSMVFDVERLRVLLSELSDRHGMALSLSDSDAAGHTAEFAIGSGGEPGPAKPAMVTLPVAQERFVLRAWPRADAAVAAEPPMVLLGMAMALSLSLGTFLLVLSGMRLRETNRELELSRAAALRLAEAKTTFVATVSHELRTPLNGVIATAELLRDSALAPPQRELVEVLISAGRGLLSLINEVLDFAKLEAGKAHLDPVPSSVHELVAEVRSLLRGEADRKGLVLETEVADDVPPRLVLDPVRLRQVLLNLVTNAIKFTHEGSVRVRARMDGRMDGRAGEKGWRLRLEVEDEGIGIEDTSILFQEFTQADASTTRRYGGTGLGLAICKRLASLMGGEIGVRSVPGQGSCFWLEVPAVVHAPPRAADAPSIRGQEAVPSGKALVIDDNPINRLVARKVLERFGWRVDLADDGRAGVDAAMAGDYDLIFMDCQMPTLDGFGATEALRARGCRVPIIAMTANSEADDRDRCMAVGMSDYLAKPVQLESVVAILQKWHGA